MTKPRTPPQPPAPAAPPATSTAAGPVVSIGIDWADQEHLVHLIEPGGRTSGRTLAQDPDEIAQWIGELRQRFPGCTLAIALEQSRGALMHALLGLDGIELYPLNPKQLARYREALDPSGGKTDSRDAELIARFLCHHRDQLRVWRPDTPETRRLAHLAEFRRRLVDERKSITLRLGSLLKLYFPLILHLFGRNLHSALVLELLRRWPALKELQRAHPKTLRAFFAEHAIRQEQKQTELIDAIRQATPLTQDAAVIDSHALYVQSLARQLVELNQAVDQFDEELSQAVAQHDDAPIFRSLPGAGDALVPRLIAAFGSDRERYDSAAELQTQSGIAPVTKRSGKSCVIVRRHACPKFLRQTFHEFANCARQWSAWSRAFYDMKRAAGMRHHAAVRALAFKWIRILFRLWKTRTTYSEKDYLQHLQQKHSPLIKFLPNTPC
jgi:transposase